jgi:excisionase family DNA binding protein
MKPEQISYTRVGAIAATGLPGATIDMAIAQGELPTIRSGRRLVIFADDLKSWLERCRAKGHIPSPKPRAEDNQRLAGLNRARRREAE